MKFYAVRKGRKVGIYTTWEECQKQTKGFSGAEFKSFNTHEEAKAYLNDTQSKDLDDTQPLQTKDYDLHIYVDGSFKDNIASWAIIILDSNKNLIDTKYGALEDTLGSRNIVGEVVASIMAMKYAFDRNMSVLIYHDYIGISEWYHGTWRANTDIAKYYINETQQYKTHDIAFQKVKGHTGNQYNELADTLAKKAFEYYKK